MKRTARQRKRTHHISEDIILGLLAKQREQRRSRKPYLTLEELERRVGLRALLTKGYTELSGEAKRLGREFKRLDI